MASAITKLERRRKYEVALGDGDDRQVVHVRALLWREVQASEKIDDDLKAAYMVGRALLEADGTQAFPEDGRGESDEAFAQRVAQQLSQVPLDTVRDVCDAIRRVQSMPDRETLRKN